MTQIMKKKVQKITSSLLLAVMVFGLGAFTAPKAAKAAPGDIGFTDSIATIFEGDVQMVQFGPLLSLDEVEYVDVTYSVDSASTADASDFIFGSAHTVRITKDNSSIPLYPVDDNPLTEGAETLILHIDSVSAPAGAQVQVDPSNSTFTLTIQDNLLMPTLNFAVPIINSPESNPGSFTVLLSRTTTSDVVFEWSIDASAFRAADLAPQTIGGTVFPADFVMASYESVIPAGELSATIPLQITNDNLFEDYELIDLALHVTNNASIGNTGELLYTINDIEDLPTLSFEHATASGDESVASPVTSLVLSNPSVYQTFVVFAPDLSGGTALFGTNEDWDLATTTLFVPVAQTRLDVNLFNIYDDAEEESAETAVAFIQSMQGATLGQFRTSTYTILASDAPAPVSGGGTAIPQSTASVGGVPVVSTVPAQSTPGVEIPSVPVTSPVTSGQVLGDQIVLVNELIAKLNYGQTSNSVNTLQTELQKLGFFPATVKTTKFYGPITRKAVEKYMDSKEWSLDQLVAMLKFGNRGTSVVKLQDQLKALGHFPASVRSTGYFYVITRAAVAKYLASK